MRDRHPSGLPLEPADVERKLPIVRIPRTDFLNPRMQRGTERTEAIGFHVIHREDDD